MKKAVLSLSGGMDSSSLMLHLLANGYQVKALSFFYGQKHKLELQKATELIQYLDSQGYQSQVEHRIVDLSSLQPLLNSNLVSGGEEVPEGHYEEKNMVKTVVPNRNKMFSSILQAVALSWANDTNSNVKIAMGFHEGDHEIYPDCRQEFRDADYEAFRIGNYDAEQVTYFTPYLKTDKFGILVDAELSCERLGIDFDEVFKRTNTSYKPIQIGDQWYSDYKSASSVERIEAFIALERADPVQYADETGLVDWEVARKHVEGVLSSHG